MTDQERQVAMAKASKLARATEAEHDKLLAAVPDESLRALATKLLRDLEEAGRSLPNGVLCYYCQRYCEDVPSDGHRLADCQAGPFGSCNFLWDGFKSIKTSE